MAAMVGAVAEHGYEAARVADLVKLSGVSRSAFYRHFDDMLDCFLATIDAFGELAAQRIRAAYESEEQWDKRLRAAAAALLELIVDQPAAARIYVVDVYAAGPAAVERLDRAVAEIERAVGSSFDESPERAGMPRDIVRGLVGGVHKAVHTRLRRGDERELVELIPELVDWGLSYHTPPSPLPRPRRQPARRAVPPATGDPVERLTAAMTEIVAEQGYPETTIAEIVNRAGASLSTFYANFATKEEAFAATVERAREEMLAAALPAYQRAPDWPRAIRDGLDALFGFMAAEPAASATALVHAFSAAARALDATAGVEEILEQVLAPGYELAPEAVPVASEAIGGAIYALVYAQIRRDRIERLRELAPTATFVAIAPFTGAGEACAVAAAPLRSR